MFISKSITSGTVILNNITFEEKIEIIKKKKRQKKKERKKLRFRRSIILHFTIKILSP